MPLGTCQQTILLTVDTSPEQSMRTLQIKQGNWPKGPASAKAFPQGPFHALGLHLRMAKVDRISS